MTVYDKNIPKFGKTVIENCEIRVKNNREGQSLCERGGETEEKICFVLFMILVGVITVALVVLAKFCDRK
jgi:hypothetical protein